MTETLKRRRGRPRKAPPTRSRQLKLTDADWTDLYRIADALDITWPQQIRNWIHQHKEQEHETRTDAR